MIHKSDLRSQSSMVEINKRRREKIGDKNRLIIEIYKKIEAISLFFKRKVTEIESLLK